MLRTLVAAIPMPYNRFLVDLNQALGKGCDVVHDHEAFWNMEGEFDAVHIHFPEYLTYEIEACLQTDITPALMAQLEERLRYWKSQVPIVVTRHVFLPHRRPDKSFQDLYELVYRYADGVVHFAEASREEYLQRYGSAFSDVLQRHVIIPHHNYESLANKISKQEARRQLGISEDSNVVLVFGAIRNEWERGLAFDTFRAINVPRKLLLASSMREKLADVKWIRLKYWLRDLSRAYYRVNPRYVFHYGFVDEEEVQIYVNAADVFFIPRGHVLNSGNMVLAFTFGKVVVGPDSGDVGQVLRDTGNPLFDPARPETAVKAVEHGFELAGADLGEQNRDLALAKWQVGDMADKYLRLYRELGDARRYAPAVVSQANV